MIHDIGSFDFSKVTYTNPKKSTGHYSVCAQSLDDNGMSGGKIYFQTPKMRLMSDMVQCVDDETSIKPFMDLSCNDDSFVKSVKEMDNNIFNVIKEKRSEWFPNKNIEDTFLEMGQTPSLMVNDVIRVRTDKHLEIFDSKRNGVDASTVSANHVVRCILQFVGIWFTSTRWGITWKVVQMLHYPERKRSTVESRTNGYMFPEDDDVSDDDDDDTPMPPPGV